MRVNLLKDLPNLKAGAIGNDYPSIKDVVIFIYENAPPGDSGKYLFPYTVIKDNPSFFEIINEEKKESGYEILGEFFEIGLTQSTYTPKIRLFSTNHREKAAEVGLRIRKLLEDYHKELGE